MGSSEIFPTEQRLIEVVMLFDYYLTYLYLIEVFEIEVKSGERSILSCLSCYIVKIVKKTNLACNLCSFVEYIGNVVRHPYIWTNCKLKKMNYLLQFS